MKVVQNLLRPQIRILPQTFRSVEIVAPITLPIIPSLSAEVIKSEASAGLHRGISGFLATRPTFEIANNYLNAPSIRPIHC